MTCYATRRAKEGPMPDATNTNESHVPDPTKTGAGVGWRCELHA
jgi:hypothetical protein